MTMKDRTIFEELKAKGEEFFTKMSGELMSNPSFTRAMQAAWWTKEKVDQAVAQALKGMRIPTREEFDRALRRIEALETEVGRLKPASRGAAGPTARSARSGAATAARATSAPASRRRSSRSGRGGTGGPAED
jgi:hypothetical protein